MGGGEDGRRGGGRGEGRRGGGEGGGEGRRAGREEGGGEEGSVLTRIFRPKGTNNIYDPAPHLECSDCQYQTLIACVPLSTKDSKSSSMFTEFCSQIPDSS